MRWDETRGSRVAEEAPLQLCQVHWETLGLEAATQADKDIFSATPLNCSPTASWAGHCLQECGREPVSPDGHINPS